MSKLYEFDMGNSTKGPIGYVARIRADSKKEAVERLRKFLPDSIDVLDDLHGDDDDALREGEEIVVCTNPDYPTERHARVGEDR